MLDEVINYLKQLQAQIQIRNMTRMPHMMMPLTMQQQQQLQMSMLARMGMVSISNMVPSTPMFVAPSFMMPSLIQPLLHHTKLFLKYGLFDFNQSTSN